MEDCPFDPYNFKDALQVNEYIKRASNETIDSLYDKIKLYVKKFNVMDHNMINLLTCTIIGSYFQDRFSTVYYLEMVGANGTGKSAFGDTYESLGYRVVKINNATEAFWIRIFGTVQAGQVTVISEEVDKLDENSNVMAMLKEGYRQNSKVPRMNSDNSKMDFYNPFCFKILIGETSPSEFKARGILDRTFLEKSYKGYPEENIKELRKLRLSPRMKKLLDELIDLRKLVLAYKLIHFNDPVSEVDVNLDGRGEELCGPALELFFNLGASEQMMKELEDTFQHFIDIKNKRKGQVLEAIIHPVIKGHITKDDNTISTSSVWDIITADGIGIKGKLDPNNDNVFYSARYGRLYRNTITKMICDRLGAETEHSRDGDVFVFDYDHFEQIGKIFNESNKIKTRAVSVSVSVSESESGCDPCDSCDPSCGKDSSSNGSNYDKNCNKISNILYNSQENLDKSDIKPDNEGDPFPQDVSRVSHVSQNCNCYYCPEGFEFKSDYQKHVLNKHPKKLCYPDKAYIEEHGLTPQGKSWE